MKIVRPPRKRPDHAGIFSVFLLINWANIHLDTKIIRMGENIAITVTVSPNQIEGRRTSVDNKKFALGFNPDKIFPEYHMVMADNRNPNNINKIFLNTAPRELSFVAVLIIVRLMTGPSRIMVTRIRKRPPVEK
jgi:hypothetical protein